jgi:hypothetical protein
MCEGRITSILLPDQATPETVMHYATLRQAALTADVTTSDPGDGEEAPKAGTNADAQEGAR